MAFLHAHLVLVLLSLSGVLVAGGGTLLVHHLVRAARSRRGHGRRGERKLSKQHTRRTVPSRHRRQAR